MIFCIAKWMKNSKLKQKIFLALVLDRENSLLTTV